MKQQRILAGLAAALFVACVSAPAYSNDVDAGADDIVSSFPWQLELGAPKSKTEQAYTNGMLIQRLRDFFADDGQTKLVNWGAGPREASNIDLTKITYPENVGVFGIFVAFEPADVGLYRALLPRNFGMPETPEVSLVIVDYNHPNPVTRYKEGMVMLKAIAGKHETWYVHSMPVEDWLMLVMGHDWGFRKEIFDMTVTETKATVHRPNGDLFMALELTDKPWNEEEALVVEGGTGGINNMAVVYPRDIELVLIFGGTGSTAHALEEQKQIVKISAGDGVDWAGLVPKGGKAPGFYKRFVPSGVGDSHVMKVR